MELRCPSKKHGELSASVVEIKCSSRFCGAGQGVVVIHRFDASTAELVETLKFKDPVRKEKAHASQRHPAAVRSA
jgi:hypothetical protein